MVFVEQALALPRSAKYKEYVVQVNLFQLIFDVTLQHLLDMMFFG